MADKSDGKTPPEGPGVSRKIILKWIFRKCDGEIDWFDLAQNRDAWRAVDTVVMKFGLHKLRRIC